MQYNLSVYRRTLLSLPLSFGGWSLLAQPHRAGSLKITAVELFRVDGHRQAVRGVDEQYQVNPLHVYAELRPRPYHDSPSPAKSMAATSALYLRIGTDAGVEGLYGPIDREAALVVHEQLRPFLIGKDPLAGEILWDQMYRSNRHSRRGLYMMAISAVDNTLWDLRGRYFETPVYRLLGGPGRRVVDVYASCLGFSLEPDSLRRKAAALKQEGYRYQKWFLAYGPGDGAEGLKKNVEVVRILRETVGDEVDLMFDVFQGWDLNYALAWAKLAEPYRPRWIEEASHAEKLQSFAELRRHTSIPVASGEHIYGRWEAQQYMQAGALNVIQADPEWCGGVSELVKICTLASIYDVHVIPHGHSVHTALHTIASQSPMTCPMGEYLVHKMESYHHFERHPLQPEKGRITLPERPGFGIELDPARIEKRSAFP